MSESVYSFDKNFEVEGANVIFVPSNLLYTPKSGYGFVTDENISEQPMLQIPAINSGFIKQDIKCDRPIPTRFKAAVEHEGNFEVTLTAENDGNEAIVFLERRRLYYLGNFSGKRSFTFVANVCDVIPEHEGTVYKDSDIDVTWIGSGLKVLGVSIKKAHVPTIYIAGDSTVTDQPANYPYSPGTSYSGWGQMLSAYLDTNVSVSNHAHSGLTTESFREEGHYSIISENIKAGDYFIMQFGHNDQKLEHLKEDTGYRANIVRYIEEIRAIGAYPLIVTSLSRNTWKNNGAEYNDLLEKYAGECIKIGKEYDVPVLDLHKFSKELVISEGLEESRKYYYPGDLSHTNDYGAYLMAGCIASEIKRIAETDSRKEYRLMGEILRKDTPKWEINRELLKLPEQKEEVQDEPYTLKMDRLEEIIRRK